MTSVVSKNPAVTAKFCHSGFGVSPYNIGMVLSSDDAFIVKVPFSSSSTIGNKTLNFSFFLNVVLSLLFISTTFAIFLVSFSKDILYVSFAADAVTL